jgi:hypothetical protein
MRTVRLLAILAAVSLLVACGKDPVEYYFNNAIEVTVYKNWNNLEGRQHVVYFTAHQQGTFRLKVAGVDGHVISERDWTAGKDQMDVGLYCPPSQEEVMVTVGFDNRQEEHRLSFSNATSHRDGSLGPSGPFG